jgi:hypothetical protein
MSDYQFAIGYNDDRLSFYLINVCACESVSSVPLFGYNAFVYLILICFLLSIRVLFSGVLVLPCKNRAGVERPKSNQESYPLPPNPCILLPFARDIRRILQPQSWRCCYANLVTCRSASP